MKTGDLNAAALTKAGLAGEGVSHGLKVVGPSEAWLGSMGGASRLLFTQGGAVQVEFGRPEITRIFGALSEMEKLKAKPSAKLLDALETVAQQLMQARRPNESLRITVPIAGHAAALEPIIPVVK